MAMQDLVVDKQQSGVAEKVVPAKFKLTEVGVIPEDWDVKTIGQLTPFITSGSRGWADFYVDYGDLFVRITNMSRNSIYLDTKTCENKFVTLPATSTEGKRTSLNNGDILISITADIGIIGYIDESITKPAYINQHISLVRFDDNSIDNKFVAYFLASENVQKKFLANSDLGAKAGMNLNSVRSIIFAVPTKKEQSAIAKALSDIDTLIVELKKVLTKKQAIKTAAMQQLLTGKTRLPQFTLREDGTVKGYKKSELGEIPEDWNIKKIAEIAIVDPENLPSSTQPDYEFDYISLEQVDYGVLLGTNRCVFSDSPSRARRLLRYNDVMVSTVRPNLKSHYLIDREVSDLICSTGFSVIRCDVNQLFPDYLYQHLFATLINNQIDMLISGSNYPAINSDNVKGLMIPISSVPEQTAIAAILSDMDKEIQALQQRLEKTRQLKQGMMQELLTGKTRLI